MPESAVPDVGGWFRTAADRPVLLPRNPVVGPGTGAFGRVSPDDVVVRAAELVRGRDALVLTGAGMSTGSGLPDYRGPDARPRSPMTYQEFVGSDLSRRRYWARSTVGWRNFCEATPNAAHQILAELEHVTPITGVVTQNVDRLHQRAGSRVVVDLHGSLADVLCLSCGLRFDRARMQDRLLELNPGVAARLEELTRQTMMLPDGDAEIDRTNDFEYPGCPACGGVLKPDVVFFGENAHRSVVEQAFGLLARSEVLVVLASSLTVMSGLRFVRRARRDDKDIVIVNDGATRGDDLATVRVHGRVADVLARWLEVWSEQASV